MIEEEEEEVKGQFWSMHLNYWVDFSTKKKKKGRIFIHKCGFGRGSLVEDDSMNVDDATR